ncbi:hypothetical protein COY34_03315 [candidate division WWE3 bacterium CG_4_10_14_0_2_um_filter_42_8]|uniref:Sodium/calcium exchanger membrane region domain-containing protein n=1 Tax=candidate division WWE3 bacterium CG_4_10_14_0_2_um_filter_42_8 TaxID=1975074 RepID=A0A2M7TBN7_UNCKA|nr:MAG: hypothetical protein COY34_03315 [candidate division WWE3 bacterium CG_4_10_14_0_2_um_filter_42_8]
MNYLKEILIVILASIVLVKSAGLTIKSLIRLSYFLKLSAFSISFILMAVATTLPENFVGIQAALSGKPELSLGNVIGSNIADLTLIVGIAILVARQIRIRSVIAKRDAFYMLAIAILPLIFLADLTLSRIEAVILIVFYIFYLNRLLHQKSFFQPEKVYIKKSEALKAVILAIGGIVFLIISARFLVNSAINLASSLNIPVVLIGMFLVAVGTSLPELAFGIQSIKKNESELALGDLMGSVVSNSTLVLAVTSLITPIKIQSWQIFEMSAFFLVFILITFNFFIRSDRKLDITEGIILIFIYLIFLMLEFGIEIYA